jgi:hypothetical protein
METRDLYCSKQREKRSGKEGMGVRWLLRSLRWV